ncbi:MAG: 4Fe-4S dicluster domain-containing protein [Bacteroidales bacterium]|nr:4Fe-4S dicluster domain-containing protein [Bacteroidales bacterium]
MLKKIRVALAVVFWLGITLLFLDFTGALHGWLGWMAKVQFLPAVLALNLAVIIGLVLLTLVFGRVYCSVICPLGVFQDGVAHLHVARNRKAKKRLPYSYSPEMKWLRYGVWVLFVVALIAGVQALVALLAPYSAWGRIVQNLFQPVYLWVNNLFAALAERAGSYAFYEKEVWLRSLPTFLVAIVTLVVVVILAWKNGRTYCNTICPVGTTLSFFSRFAMFRPVIDTEKCKNCKQCEHACKAACIDIANHKIDYSRCVDCFNCIDTCKFGALHYQYAWGSSSKTAQNEDGKAKSSVSSSNKAQIEDEGRRAFVTGAALAVGTAALKAQEKKVDGGFATILDKEVPARDVPITPPGSKSIKDFYRRCTACQLCVAECPNQVLRPSTDLKHFMQPEMSYERGYCRPECTRCSEVCPTGAILQITKEEKTRYHIGTAQVNRTLCVSDQGTECGNCARHCPAGAILMVEDEATGFKHPVVNEELCIGCGACENLCPSRPISAITVNGRHNHLD